MTDAFPIERLAKDWKGIGPVEGAVLVEIQ